MYWHYFQALDGGLRFSVLPDNRVELGVTFDLSDHKNKKPTGDGPQKEINEILPLPVRCKVSRELAMGIQEILDLQIGDIMLRNVARVIVFGGIAVILIRKLVRRIRGDRRDGENG